MSSPRSPLYFRAFAALTGIGAVGVAAAALLLWGLYRADAVEAARVNLDRIARRVAEGGAWPGDSEAPGVWISLYDSQGRLVRESGGSDAEAPADAAPEVVQAAAVGHAVDVRRATRESSVDSLFTAVRGSAGVGRAAAALTHVAEARVKFMTYGAGALAFVIVGAALGAYGFAASHARAAAPLVQAAREIAEGDLRARIRSNRLDELGELARAVDAVADRRMAVLRQAEEERGELRAILDNAAEGIVVLGPGGRIQLINAAARVMFNAPLDATGRPFVEVTRNSQIQRFLEHIRDGPTVQQIDAQIGDEDPRTIRIAGGPIPDVKGNEGRVVLLATDVSDLRRLERMRVDFVANASHELKTPLASILGYAETLRDDGELDDSTRRQFLDTILRNARRLEDLVTDMLRLARLDSDAGTWKFEAVDPGELVERVVQEHVKDARERGVRLTCQVSRAAGAVTADAELVRQCISNLVGNAVKFTPSGGAVDVLVQAAEGGVAIDVIDTGVGIAPDHIPRIFERFYRADAGRAREVGGTGLGLAIAKHATAVHGGRIDVESTLGRGSRFRVFLPSVPPER
jgi:two-component system phosphate regulon sensor histidine kinase PhoR